MAFTKVIFQQLFINLHKIIPQESLIEDLPQDHGRPHFGAFDLGLKESLELSLHLKEPKNVHELFDSIVEVSSKRT